MTSALHSLPTEQPIPTVIIEDSPNIRALLADNLERHFPGTFIIVGESGRVNHGANIIRQVRPELVLLDIELLDGTCFDLLDMLDDVRSTFTVTFITSFDKYVRKGLEYGGVSFIDKPIAVKDFVHGITLAINNVRKRQTIKQQWQAEVTQRLKNELEATVGIMHSNGTNAPVKLSTITIKKRDGTNESLAVEDIIYCLADGSYTEVYCSNDNVHVDSKPLARYEDLLSRQGFVRISRSMLVNPLHCTISRVSNNDFLIVLPDGYEHYAEGKYREELAAQWKKYEQAISLLKTEKVFGDK
ncbi:MAG: LytTR family DNA-binding domain-containing protein [Candidatus Kapabacteria bacterium]|jgi:two-component system LytT family response regulator|nr:LytTR family DNA-binding domain-containing protein [Candidatus Kapabacteria bacterium]